MNKKYKILTDGKGLFEQEIIENICEARGIDDIEHFLLPKESDLLPFENDHIRKAYNILNTSIINKEKIGILFDCDCDGLCSGTIITRYIRNYNIEPNTYINQGKIHGIQKSMVDILSKNDLLIVVDSLNSDITEYKEIKEKGTKIIVLDHHNIDKNIEYDNYVTLISSQRDYNNKELSGSGVTWKFCKYMDYMNCTDYADDLTDLAACGILADVCSVSKNDYENRYIVYTGLKNLNNPAIKKILGSYQFNSKSVLFSIAPLINACMRCGNNEIAMSMFLSDDNKEILKLKKELESYKEMQTEEVESCMDDINKQIEEQKNKSVLSLFINSNYGISGLIGNKILETVNKPLFVINKNENGILYGSMRSVGCGNFMKLCNDIEIAELHGHEEASGFQCEENRYDEFLEKIRNIIKIDNDKCNEIEIDAEIYMSDITKNLIKIVQEFNFVSGKGFKEIQFKITDINNYEISNWKQGKHLIIKPSDYLYFIEWNTKCDYEELEDASILNENIECYATLESGYVGKNFILKAIMSDYKIGV